MQKEPGAKNIMEQLELLQPEDKGTQLIEKQRIGVSPLEKIYTEEKGAAVVLGKYRITEWFTDDPQHHAEEKPDFPLTAKGKLDQYLEQEPEDFIIRLVSTMLAINDNKLETK